MLVFLVPQAEAQRHVRTHSPIVLQEQAGVELVHLSEWIAGRNRELAGAAARLADLLAAQMIADPLQR